jgi:hypothetical protein
MQRHGNLAQFVRTSHLGPAERQHALLGTHSIDQWFPL